MAAIGARALGDLGEGVARTADLGHARLAVLGLLVLLFVVLLGLVLGVLVVVRILVVRLVLVALLVVLGLVVGFLGLFGLVALHALGDRRRGGDGLRLDRLRLGGSGGVRGRRVRSLGDRGDVGGLDRGGGVRGGGRLVGRRVGGGGAGRQGRLGQARGGVAAGLDRGGVRIARRGGRIALGPLLDEGRAHGLDRLGRGRVGGLTLAGNRVVLGDRVGQSLLRLHRVVGTGAAGLGPAPARAAAPRRAALLALAVLLLLARLGLDQSEAVGHRDLVVVGVDLVEGEEAVAVAAVLDEGRLERGLHAGHLGEIDIAPQRPAVGRLEIKFLDPRALHGDDPGLLRMRRIDEHLVVGHDELSTWRPTSFSSRVRRVVPAEPRPAPRPEGRGRAPASLPRPRMVRGGDCRQPPSGAEHRRAGG
ncbi:hypothetical protein CHKEEEPN_4398 [Methylorubrum podarium]|nr:hypothetical protein CHKEEEPN_4398 [Methylorubrum podarium]